MDHNMTEAEQDAYHDDMVLETHPLCDVCGERCCPVFAERCEGGCDFDYPHGTSREVRKGITEKSRGYWADVATCDACKGVAS